MRDVSDLFTAAVRGSNTPLFVADFWYGSDVLRAEAQIIGGQLATDSRNAVEGDLSITILDTESEGSRLKDIIHSYGCVVNIRAGFELAGEQELVSIGWFEVVETDAAEEWTWYDWRAEAVKVSAVVQITGRDLISTVAGSGLFAPTQPTPGADGWATIADLCRDVVSVKDPGLPARALPSGNSAIVLEKDRLAGIQAIANLWPAKPVMTDDGQLTLVTPGSGDLVDAYGLDINIEAWRNKTSSQDLVNGIEFRGKTAEGLELRGYATEDSGPLFWGGPYGRRPGYAASDLMTTQAMVDAAARTELDRRIAARSAVQTVKALWNPAQEVRDRPALELPDREVQAAEILAITLPLGAPPSGGGSMSVTLALPLLLEE